MRLSVSRCSAALCLGMTLTLAPVAASAQSAAPTAPSPSLSPAPPYAKKPDRFAGVDVPLLAAGAGAIAGITLFNVLTGPFATVPLAGGALAAVPTEVALGSRFIAVLTGAAGGLLASEAYDLTTGTEHDYGYMAALAVGAAGGVLAVNLLSGWGGAMPFYNGAGTVFAGAEMASSASQAASRIKVIASGVLGAWVADAIYNASEDDPAVAP